MSCGPDSPQRVSGTRRGWLLLVSLHWCCALASRPVSGDHVFVGLRQRLVPDPAALDAALAKIIEPSESDEAVSFIQRGSHFRLLEVATDTADPEDALPIKAEDIPPYANDEFKYGLPPWCIAIGVCLSASCLTVFGLALQKKGASNPEGHWKIFDFVICKETVVGICLIVIAGFPMDLLAYSLAPMSLTTPLSGVTVALNLVFAERLVGEKLQPWPDIPATGFIVVGTLCTTYSAAHQEPAWNSELLWHLLRSKVVRICLVLMLSVIICSIGIMLCRKEALEESARRRPTNPQIFEVVLPAITAGAAGCLSNIFLKAVGVLLKNTGYDTDIWPWMCMTAVCATVQLNYMNRGLMLYPQTVFVPVYSAFLVVLSTVVGSIFYQEHSNLMNQIRWQLFFITGVCVIAGGITMFTLREAPHPDGPKMLPHDSEKVDRDREQIAKC